VLRRRAVGRQPAAGALIGTEFLPPSDEGEVRVTGEMDVGTRLD
jgi:multidrug efflux pump subunit AcrB